MGTKRALALLVVLILVFGMISSTSAASFSICRYCGEDSAYLYNEVSDEPELLFFWQDHPTISTYGRWVWECYHYYECISCGVEYRLKVQHHGPWELEG